MKTKLEESKLMLEAKKEIIRLVNLNRELSHITLLLSNELRAQLEPPYTEGEAALLLSADRIVGGIDEP